MNTLIIILIIAICYWKIRNLYYNSIELEFQLTMFKLRDKLRMSAIDGKVKAHEWFFDYLDSSICKSIEEVASLNIISILFLFQKNKNNEIVRKFLTKVESNINNNKYSKELFDEYGSIMLAYIIKKHYIIKCAIYCLHGILSGVSYISKTGSYVSNAVNKLRVYPETSTAFQYAT